MQFNPFSGSGLDPNAHDWRSDLEATESAPYAKFLEGITFRFSAYESRQEWTESHVSQIIAGRDMTLESGNNLSLVGGTVASSSANALLYAGNDLLLSALADTQSSKSSSWGASLGFSEGGITLGGNFANSLSSAKLYTNAGLTAGEVLSLISGHDMTLAGANVAANDIYLYTGGDLVVQSRQNVSTSSSSGWDFSVTFNGSAITGASFSVNGADANRTYTDTPTTISAENTLD
ncbi:MAG: hypothetical protein GY934_14270, partial [Gammaproteobacteria bacterium]|nr:hypothetical protein [Gammaproteobacteria bacterium]